VSVEDFDRSWLLFTDLLDQLEQVDQ